MTLFWICWAHSEMQQKGSQGKVSDKIGGKGEERRQEIQRIHCEHFSPHTLFTTSISTSECWPESPDCTQHPPWMGLAVVCEFLCIAPIHLSCSDDFKLFCGKSVSLILAIALHVLREHRKVVRVRFLMDHHYEECGWFRSNFMTHQKQTNPIGS